MEPGRAVPRDGARGLRRRFPGECADPPPHMRAEGETWVEAEEAFLGISVADRDERRGMAVGDLLAVRHRHRRRRSRAGRRRSSPRSSGPSPSSTTGSPTRRETPPEAGTVRLGGLSRQSAQRPAVSASAVSPSAASTSAVAVHRAVSKPLRRPAHRGRPSAASSARPRPPIARRLQAAGRLVPARQRHAHAGLVELDAAVVARARVAGRIIAGRRARRQVGRGDRHRSGRRLGRRLEVVCGRIERRLVSRRLGEIEVRIGFGGRLGLLPGHRRGVRPGRLAPAVGLGVAAVTGSAGLDRRRLVERRALTDGGPRRLVLSDQPSPPSAGRIGQGRGAEQQRAGGGDDNSFILISVSSGGADAPAGGKPPSLAPRQGCRTPQERRSPAFSPCRSSAGQKEPSSRRT